MGDTYQETILRTCNTFVKTTESLLAKQSANQHVDLNFRAINYSAEVYLNGHKELLPKGMFRRHSIDASDFLKPNGENLLAVLVYPPDHPGEIPPAGGQGGDHESVVVARKLDFPTFHGKDPMAWLSRAEWYFRLHQAEESAKVERALINSVRRLNSAISPLPHVSRDAGREPRITWDKTGHGSRTCRSGPSAWDVGRSRMKRGAGVRHGLLGTPKGWNSGRPGASSARLRAKTLAEVGLPNCFYSTFLRTSDGDFLGCSGIVVISLSCKGDSPLTVYRMGMKLCGDLKDGVSYSMVQADIDLEFGCGSYALYACPQIGCLAMYTQECRP
ncbi:mannosylglycoprotein endo-beta-mannosidase [Phtheirospermum japonicum]|uniref:Mannosylglycoprotein endo-beta-mannosidase n=1 Tax=Phtheirospermum japonicum TaxID=374723 RepID=A0A830BUU3_9LAMI|nr:mannosylglycoprotein endo-beta-mannosidase [Phtheirospermum japonicum]